jgi:RimJ/RimL family protein N-acetyltransferase
MITIRNLTKEDAGAFLQMLNQLDNETKYMMYEAGERPQDVILIQNKLASADESSSLLICAENDGEIVGFLSAGKGDFIRNRHSAYIVIGILKKGQSKGLGTAMFEKLLQWAKLQRITRLELTVMCHNVSAIALYRKFGFEIEGTKRNSLIIDDNYVDEYYMARLL